MRERTHGQQQCGEWGGVGVGKGIEGISDDKKIKLNN